MFDRYNILKLARANYKMPVIAIKDYEWRQTDDFIIIQVNANITLKNVDLLIVDDYVKAHFKPFILELFLWSSVKDEESFCTIADKELCFTLKKDKCGIVWPNLETLDLTKQMKTERRNCALKLKQELNEIKSKNKLEKKTQLRKQAVQAQIDCHTERINKIENIRDTCRKETMKELDEWSKKHAIPCLDNEKKVPQTNIIDYRKSVNITNTDKSNIMKDKTEDTKMQNTSNNKIVIEEKVNNSDIEESYDIWNSIDSDSDTDEDNKTYKPGEKTVREVIARRRLPKKTTVNDLGQSIPLPRKYGTIEVTFSERVFVTPARESFKEKEEEWLEKQAKARRSTGFVAEDLRPEEQDPQWCLDKGENFMKVGNYLGAISAFSHGIKLNDKMESLYVMRSAAHYAVANYQRCIEDASKALELMVPECEANRELRARCYARRGAALCQLSVPQHGLPELEMALKLLPNDIQIQTDIRKIKQHFDLS